MTMAQSQATKCDRCGDVTNEESYPLPPRRWIRVVVQTAYAEDRTYDICDTCKPGVNRALSLPKAQDT
jgi:hypothetical protein